MHKTLSQNASLPSYLTVSSIYLALQAFLLFLSPKLIVTLLGQDPRPPTTDLEAYLCRALAWSLMTIAGFGGGVAIALGREREIDGSVGSGDENASSQAVISTTSLLLPATLIYHTASTIQAYINYSSPSPQGNPAFLLNTLGSAVLTVYGFWVLMFGSEVRVSSKDGSDKRVSGFLFGGGGKKGKEL